MLFQWWGYKFSIKQQGTVEQFPCCVLLMYLAICVFSFFSGSLEIAFQSKVKRLN